MQLAVPDRCRYTQIMKPRDHDLARYMVCADCFCQASRLAARKITRLFDSRMQETGVRMTQFTILARLMLMGETPVGKLARILGMERTTLTRNLAPLEQRKWISATPGDDPRSRMIATTASGREVVRRAFPVWARVQAEVGKLLGAEGQAALKVLATRKL